MKRRDLITGTAALATYAALGKSARAFGMGAMGRGFGHLGATSKKSGGQAPPVSNTMSLDGSAADVNTTGLTASISLSTTKTNNVIVVMVFSNQGPLVSVTGSTLGAFTKRASTGSGANIMEEWYAISPGILTMEIITAICPASGFSAMIGFAVNGAKTSAPFDTNVALPSIGATDPVTVSTTATNTMVLGAFRMSTDTPSAGTGFTQIENPASVFMLAEYKIVSSPQTNLSVTVGIGAGTTVSSIGDALVQGP